MWPFSPSYNSLCEKAIKAIEAHDLGRALKILNQAIGIEPNNPRAHGWVAMAYVDAAKEVLQGARVAELDEIVKTAEQAFESAISFERDPVMKAEFLWQKACLYGVLGRSEEQHRALAAADEVSPGFVKERQDGLLRAAFGGVR